jgi:hypothetical protein
LAEDQVYISQPVEPRDIPYRALLPEFGECHILRVPFCISASTIALAYFRMEPQFMIAGQATGAAAKLSGPVHNVPINELQEKLAAAGQILQAP